MKQIKADLRSRIYHQEFKLPKYNGRYRIGTYAGTHGDPAAGRLLNPYRIKRPHGGFRAERER